MVPDTLLPEVPEMMDTPPILSNLHPKQRPLFKRALFWVWTATFVFDISGETKENTERKCICTVDKIGLRSGRKWRGWGSKGKPVRKVSPWQSLHPFFCKQRLRALPAAEKASKGWRSGLRAAMRVSASAGAGYRKSRVGLRGLSANQKTL